MDNMDKQIPYKYYVVCGEEGEYEVIPKESPEGFCVNRCLFIQLKYLSGTDWHQFDDIICKESSSSRWNIVISKNANIVERKKKALQIMLDSLFCILNTSTSCSVENFFQQFQQFYLVNRKLMVHEGEPKEWTDLQFDEKQVQKVIKDYLEDYQKSAAWNTSEYKKLVLTLTIFLLSGDFYVIPKSKQECIRFCSLLCLKEQPLAKTMNKVKEVFSKISWCPPGSQIPSHERLGGYLRMFCNFCIVQQVHQWLWTIPVLHLFTDFEYAQENAQLESEDAWARLKDLPFVQYRIDEEGSEKFLLPQMKEKKYLVKESRALFRSWFSLLPRRALAEFISDFPAEPVDYLLGIFHRLENVKATYTCEEVEKFLMKVLDALYNKQNEMLQQDTWNSYVTVCQRLHEKICRKFLNLQYYKIPAVSVNIISRILEFAPSEASRDKAMQNTPKTVYQWLHNTTRDWFCGVLPTRMLKPVSDEKVQLTFSMELEAWNRFLKINFRDANLTEDWKGTLIKDMQSRIKQVPPLQQIKAYCRFLSDFEKYEPLIGKSFESCAIEAVNLEYKSDLIHLMASYNLSKLVSAVITKSWPIDKEGKPLSDLEGVLHHLLVWPGIQHLFTFKGGSGDFLSQLTDDAKALMKITESVHKEIYGNLMTGQILIRHLELIIKCKEQFVIIWELMNKSLSSMEKPKQKLKLEEVLQLRLQELTSVKEEQKQLELFLSMFRKVEYIVKVDIAEMEQKHRENLSSKALHDVVNVRHSVLQSDDKIETHYHLSPAQKKMTETLNNFKESNIFQYCWEWAAEKLASSTEDLSKEESIDILNPDFLFKSCYNEFFRLYECLKSEELTFAEVDLLFKNFTNHYDGLKKDFQIICRLQPQDSGKWVEQRVEQIQQYHKLHLALGCVKVIDKVREGLNLSGDFSDLQLLLKFEDELQSFEREKLSSISASLIHAMKVLQDITEPRRRCLEELAWRREFVSWVKKVIKDINELKVFVDLASISAGENDMDVDRVACFHDAVLGYSSLLYELKQESGFEEFLVCLEKLWKALESDPKLPEKLCDSARYLKWLKDIKETHGSVEQSSLSLATTINSNGIYQIRAPEEGQKVSLDTVLCLTVSQSHGGQEEIRQYSLEELQELMNKLMLMSGKIEQSTEVEKFSEVFSSVQRLALSFIDLYCAGNMLFRSWVAGVYCSPSHEFCLSMDFNLNSGCALIGNGDVTEVLPTVCQKMESFLEKWNQFMSEERSQYFYLNYYMAEQLVYLCKELGSKCPSEAALTMLSFIKRNCSKQDAQEVFSQVVSKKAKRNFADLLGPVARGRELAVQLEYIWESYMRSMGSFLPGCLDIETLGIYLATLADLEKRGVMRKLPQGLHAGRPNLILCPRSEVLASALAIYMNSPGEMLPSYDEVLLCTPQTSYEQVALFLRRCITPGYKGKKIYTLLFADELSYDVGYRSEELFQSLHFNHHDNYRLVILCNCEREHCYIPSVFSQFKVHMIPQQPLKDIQGYLENHYKATQPPSSVFKDQMCVGIVASERAGAGKSLYVKRLQEKMEAKLQGCGVILKTIRLIDPEVDEGKVLRTLLPFLENQYQKQPMIFHFDITSSVQTGIPEFLFKLLVLQYLINIDGKLWLRKQYHLYVVEILEPSPPLKKSMTSTFPGLKYNFMDVFPKVTCRYPKEVLDMDMQMNDCSDPGIDQEVFRSEAFQRPYQYLRRSSRGDSLDTFQYEEGSVAGTPAECLQMLLIHCGVIDPSWSELRNFAWFLNLQLRNCETSVFCNAAFVHDALHGFKNFVVTFMILMAKDFATPSLNISDESPGNQFFDMERVKERDLVPLLLRKKWESEPHPYIFFNDDSVSMTFIGFHLQKRVNGSIDAINPLNGSVIREGVMTPELYEGLLHQRVPLNINFDELPRNKKIEKLCMVLGIQWPIDPDDTYELTTDNMLKILAIEMRFRCGIPVVLMGETGCGKTRLIKFLCELRRSGASANNMKLVKVHGGTTADAIYAKVREAEDIAIDNKQQYQFDTILFFDEANTTEAVSSIKEVLCDRTVEGQPLVRNSGLQIIAACNPYRKHTGEMIQRLESSGLGYRVKAEETKEKLGSIPLRQLVYRVHALPPSMIPLVWDFGQLNNVTEKLYIQQMVQRLTSSIPMSDVELQLITDVLFQSQTYMRQRNDECSFISLRDVERCVEVFKWFHNHSEILMKHLEKQVAERKAAKGFVQRDPVIWSLVLSVGVCYHASLERKKEYRRVISTILPKPYDGEKEILEEIGLVQDLFLSDLPLREMIAKNLALKENVFMMVICIELKIPLFLIGKPGSSKSLAKTIVADAMQGQAAYTELYKELKQIHLVSFQCSPHSTPEGIINTFKHCARFQEGKNLKEYVSVVVLDEIGLAEDSPKMPLKTLHPLLEDGCVDDDPLPHKKVGFIGISNWALDPAKMNRGIFVSRGEPNKRELLESAKGICSSERAVLHKIDRFFPIFANAYEEICKTQGKEFFGLRDYYSLIKMVFALSKKLKREPAPRELAEIVLRNFSGKEGVEALNIFMSRFSEKGDIIREDIGTIDLVQQNIYSDYEDGECRYLLVLTENYAALQILQQAFFKGTQQPEIIFGSSFPKDQEYTQICRNINRVKICMETGQMVILLNLQNLYESLYDALNQYYVQLAGQKYVDLGLGTHRVKCRVHPKFRLIVIEEKEVVYKQFPIPLINRLEKHYLDINTVLDKRQRDTVEELKKWVDSFTAVETEKYFIGQQKFTPSDVFVGYHPDICASVVLQVTEKLKIDASPQELMQKVQEEAKLVLLNCATPDSVVRLGDSRLGSFLADDLARVYFQQQYHTSLAEFLRACLGTKSRGHTIFTEISTFSRLLTAADTETLKAEVQGELGSLKVLFLQQFDTEYSFLKEIRNFLDATSGSKILIIQTHFENGSLSAQLVASARYSVVNEINKSDQGETSVFVFFITKLPRAEGGSSYVGFQGGLWQSVHIDDLRKSKDIISDVTALRNVTISQLFSAEPPEILDTTILLRSCVQRAVGMLEDQNKDASRSTKRIEILLSLLSQEDDLKASFLKITKTRLLSLLGKQEENVYTMKEWVRREASNLNALQEAGTFRDTLWKRVQSVVTPFMAYMLSVLDSDCNLDLLVRPTTEKCVKALWIFIFNDLKLLDIPYIMGQNNSQTETIQVQSYFKKSTGAGNEMPFSWKIKDYLEDLWGQAQYIPGNEDRFVSIFQKKPLGQYIADLPEEEREHLFHCYVRDFILLTMGASSNELMFLQTALLSCMEEMKAASSNAEERVLPLPCIHLCYHQFRSRLQNLSRIFAVYPDVSKALTEHVEKGNSFLHRQMVLDVLAAIACTEMLEEKLLNWGSQKWLKQVKKLQMPIELVCTANYIQNNGSQCDQLLQELRSQWNRIFSLSLFVEHVLLGVEMQIPEVKKLVKKFTSRLGKCFQGDSDIKTHNTFCAVMNILCQCKEDASSVFCSYGLRPCPICLEDPREPVHLPCDHVYCHHCIKQRLVPGEMRCPSCKVELPDDYSPKVSEEIRVAIKKMTQFRKCCNSFFIELVSTMCFKDNEPPEKAVIQELLNLLKGMCSCSKNYSVYTKTLSPFNDVVDKTPVIRSVVLKLLLKYSFNDVKVHVQKYLSDAESICNLDKEDKTVLYTLFASCLEDSMCEKFGASSEKSKANCLREDGHFLTNYIKQSRSSHETSQKVTIEYLQGVAHTRLCMDRAAQLLFELHGTSGKWDSVKHNSKAFSFLFPASSQETEKQHYLEKVKQFCSQIQNDWYRVYLIRTLTKQHGMEFTQRLSNESEFNWIFPAEIIQQKFQSSQIDQFLVHGKNYKVVRDALGKAVIECQADGIAAALKESNVSKSVQAVHFLLAVFRELTSLYGCKELSLHPKQEQRDVIKEFIQSCNVLPSPELGKFAESLMDNHPPSLALSPQDSSHKRVVIEMAIHTAAVLLSGQNQILEPLRNLAFSLHTMQVAFLPTMPEDLLAQAVRWEAAAGLRWYTCPNGHPCTVGECGRPTQRGLCNECGAVIGGFPNHTTVPGFDEIGSIQDRSQTGHVLGQPEKREAEVASEREMSPAVLILIRLLTHLSLLLGATKDHQSLLQIIKPPVPDPVSFLMQHIHKDLEQLMNTLGKSADETTSVVHLILCSLLKERHQQTSQCKENSLQHVAADINQLPPQSGVVLLDTDSAGHLLNPVIRAVLLGADLAGCLLDPALRCWVPTAGHLLDTALRAMLLGNDPAGRLRDSAAATRQEEEACHATRASTTQQQQRWPRRERGMTHNKCSFTGSFDSLLSKRKDRNDWEGIVAQNVVIPELKFLDKTLLEVNQQISEDKRMASNLIARIIYGDPAAFLSELPSKSTVHCSRMWSCRKRISVEHLAHIVQQKDGKETVPILWKFLQKEAELKLVKFLPEILALQKDLVKRFQNISELEFRTISNFLNKVSPEFKNLMKSRVNTFLNVWNKLRSSLETSGEIKLPKGYCDTDLTLESEFEILLPRRRGLGLFSTALASYLIGLHNDFVYTVEGYTTDAKRYSVSPAEVTDLHVIAYDVERDLIPLILSNCQYSMKKGGEALQEFDLEKIEQQLASRFLQGKPLITLKGIPTLVYRHEQNYEHLFNEINSKLSQISLPNSTIGMISGKLLSYSDICEALSITEITLGFLAKAGGDSKMTLTEYVEDILQMGSQTNDHVLKALSQCHLEHTIALWQLLLCYKSEQLLHLKRDPFAEVGAAYKDELTAENTELLYAFLMQAGLGSFLQELHEMIILKLKHAKAGDGFEPTWGLKATLTSYLERKGSNVLEELEDTFPEEIPLSQCIAAWKVAATLKRERRLG
ncbi:E3 ubiquitin-protein ligase RNF213-like [Zootoca vivipara]|uniref:E3 ubiquitin-protein ligase RNF213-like n=1 Tax=Zootoca vivipara TaxID=8524 RepID=UPI00293C0F6B|nr:E3 ubiquitin-protein ligase RNF213-like [Zootoca vivipara]